MNKLSLLKRPFLLLSLPLPLPPSPLVALAVTEIGFGKTHYFLDCRTLFTVQRVSGGLVQPARCVGCRTRLTHNASRPLRSPIHLKGVRQQHLLRLPNPISHSLAMIHGLGERGSATSGGKAVAEPTTFIQHQISSQVYRCIAEISNQMEFNLIGSLSVAFLKM